MYKIQKKYYNKTHTLMKFNMRDKILIKTQNINFLYFFHKLNHKYTNSFEIIILWSKQIYKLKLLFYLKMIHFIFHVSLLELYKEKKNEQ